MENMEELAGTDNIEELQEKMDNIEALQEKWQGLSISNDFLFGKVMQDPCLCTELLQMILPDVEIGHIEYPELQKNMEQDRDAHGVRLDVYVKDGKGTVYDIEMQVANTKELPKRSRYYQGMIDLQLLDKGQHYKKLNQTYIIFIPASNEPSSRACADIWRMPRGLNTPPLGAERTSQVMPHSLLRGI